MIISKAFDYYMAEINSGRSHEVALENACHVWDVTADQLNDFINIFK